MTGEAQTAKLDLETTQTLDTLLHQVLNLALVSIDAEAGSIMLVANKRGILQIKARLGKPRPGRRREDVYKINETSIASWVAKNKKSYLCPDVAQDPYFATSSSGRNFLSLLSVPVIHQGKVVAVINADAPVENYFTEKHREILEYVAEQVAVPIAERISILDALGEVGVELSRLPNEGGVEPVLARIAQLAVRSLGADLVTVYQYNQAEREFPVEGIGPTIYPGVRDDKPMLRKIHPGDVPWTVVNERKSGFYADVEKVDFLTGEVIRPGDTPRPRFVEREHIKSMAALLLPFRAAEVQDEEVVGVMFVNYRTPHDFNIDEIAALSTFADYAAVAILNARLEQKRRAEQIRIAEMISANFAHRMGNLAGTSRVASQLLREHINENDAVALRQLDRIERESSILLELADRIARPFKTTGTLSELVPVNIATILSEEVERIHQDSGSIALETNLAEVLPTVQSVEFQLRQVFYDIMRNGIESMRDRNAGRLSVTASCDLRSHRVVVEISDTGGGISDDIREKLFAPGITTKKDKLGIGLWWCRTFMRATGGDVLLKETRLGEGSTFVVEIPYRDDDEFSSLDDLPQRDILVVDDDQEWREQIVDILARFNWTIDTAENYIEASRRLHTYRYRLAMLDVRLVDADLENREGLRLLTEIDQFNLDTKVIMMTAYGTEQVEEIARRSPRLQAFLYKKAVDLGELRAQVSRALQGQTS